VVGAKGIKGSRRRDWSKVTLALLACCFIVPLILITIGFLGIRIPSGSSGQPLELPKLTSGQADLKSLIVKTVDGEDLALGNTSGKPRVIVAVATWCPTCALALMNVKKAVEQFNDEVSVVVVGVWSEGLVSKLSKAYTSLPAPDTPESLKRFVERFGDPRWKIVMDSDTRVLNALKLKYIDAIIVLDKNGVEVYRVEPGGYVDPKEIAKIVENVLRQ